MKLSHLNCIISQIRNGAKCPNCKKPLKESDIDVGEIIQNEAEFCVYCPHCQADLSILVHVLSIPRLPVGLKSFFSKPEISQKEIKSIVKAVHDFKGKDVQDLFDGDISKK